jgi:uncharacterized protein (UPF0276 family)
LTALRDRHPIALHGVGLSIASAAPPDADHLTRLKTLIDRIEPLAVSDHLAWRRQGEIDHSDFLPFPRTWEALAQVCDNVDRIQAALGRPLLVENPSLYIDLPGHALSEVEFLTELARRTGCGLLLDVNNVHVSAANLGFNAQAYLDAIPGELVGEIHLAGHGQDADPASPLLIDSHDAPISAAVWALHARLIARIGPRPTLIERDDNLPPFAELMAEREAAHAVLTQDDFNRASHVHA